MEKAMARPVLFVSPHMRPPACYVHDGLLHMMREGRMLAFRSGGRLRFVLAEQATPRIVAAQESIEEAEAELRRAEPRGMAPWN